MAAQTRVAIPVLIGAVAWLATTAALHAQTFTPPAWADSDDGDAALAGARKVISPTNLFERLDHSPDDRVDASAFLAARLLDILMGDRDRHRDQFRWATRTFGSVEGETAMYLSAPIWSAPTLALRAGGKRLWGTFPFHESAFLGGRSSLRGFYQDRFAGDASVYGNAELRLTLTRSYWILPALWGIFGSADAGRVYVDGASPGGWHTAGGGGIWIAFLDRANTATLGFATSRERTAVYAGVGFPF